MQKYYIQKEDIYENEIKKDTLADALVLGETKGFVKENDINGEKITLGVEKR